MTKEMVTRQEFIDALEYLYEYTEAIRFNKKPKRELTDEQIVEYYRIINIGRTKIYDKEFHRLSISDSLMAVTGPINIKLNLINKWYATYVGIGYKIPEFKEFVQDFEFEYLFTTGGERGLLLNKSNETESGVIELFKIPETSHWGPMKVWWKPRTKEEAKATTELENGMKVTHFIGEWDAPISVLDSIESKRVRVKIK